MVELLRPEHAGQRLALDEAGVGVAHAVLEHCVEGVGLRDPLREQGVEAALVEAMRVGLGEAVAQDDRLAGRDGVAAEGGAFGALAQWVHMVARPRHHVVVDRILGVVRSAGTEEAGRVGLVLAEQKLRRLEGPEQPDGAGRAGRLDPGAFDEAQQGLLRIVAP